MERQGVIPSYIKIMTVKRLQERNCENSLSMWQGQYCVCSATLQVREIYMGSERNTPTQHEHRTKFIMKDTTIRNVYKGEYWQERSLKKYDLYSTNIINTIKEHPLLLNSTTNNNSFKCFLEAILCHV